METIKNPTHFNSWGYRDKQLYKNVTIIKKCQLLLFCDLIHFPAHMSSPQIAPFIRKK